MHKKSISTRSLTASIIISVCAFLHALSLTNADGEYSTLGSSDGGDYQNNQAGTSTPILISPGAATSPQLQQEFGQQSQPQQQLLPTFASYGTPAYTPFLEPFYRPYPYRPNLPPPTPPYGFGPPGWGFNHNHGWNNNPGWSVPIQQLPPPNFFSGWGWPGPFRSGFRSSN